MKGLIGAKLGQYKLIDIVGEGGMSTVYRAYQESLDRYVAVKVLLQHHDPQFGVRFKREARSLALLQHPNILPIHDYGEQKGRLYFVLQYVENGRTLNDLLGRPLEVVPAIRLIKQVLEALEYAHERGIVHRDIKPGNILLPSQSWPLLADFGIAKFSDEALNLTIPGLVIGTAAYMSPEQADGQPIDTRADLYSMGVVLYEMLTGKVPFDAPTPMAVLNKHVYAAPPSPRSLNPHIPLAVEHVLLKVLAKAPHDRYQRAAHLAEALEQAATETEPVQLRVRAAATEQHHDTNNQRADATNGQQAHAMTHQPSMVRSSAAISMAEPVNGSRATITMREVPGSSLPTTHFEHQAEQLPARPAAHTDAPTAPIVHTNANEHLSQRPGPNSTSDNTARSRVLLLLLVGGLAAIGIGLALALLLQSR